MQDKIIPYGMAYNAWVTRHWKSFDKEVTDKEFAALPLDDRIDLFEAMKLYRLDVPKGYVIKSYGDGLMMIKPQNGRGRCLFFTEVEVAGIRELVAPFGLQEGEPEAPGAKKATRAPTNEGI